MSRTICLCSPFLHSWLKELYCGPFYIEPDMPCISTLLNLCAKINHIPPIRKPYSFSPYFSTVLLILLQCQHLEGTWKNYLLLKKICKTLFSKSRRNSVIIIIGSNTKKTIQMEETLYSQYRYRTRPRKNLEDFATTESNTTF